VSESRQLVLTCPKCGGESGCGFVMSREAWDRMSMGGTNIRGCDHCGADIRWTKADAHEPRGRRSRWRR
jgi:endogenous inhibitor of DNA gyrase (YacG/DUF329 family)